MPTISEKSTSATNALISAFLKMNATPGRRDTCVNSDVDDVTLDFFDFGAAEQAGRKEDQHHDQDRERGDVLVFDGEIGRPEGFDQTDQETAEHRTGQRSDAAENGCGESLDAGDKAHEEIYQAIVEQVHHAGDGGERGTDHESHGDGAITTAAGARPHGLILPAGAHLAPQPRPRYQPGEEGEQYDGGDDDEDLHI